MEKRLYMLRGVKHRASHLHGVFVLPGLLAHEQLPQDDAKAVDVALLIVALQVIQSSLPPGPCNSMHSLMQSPAQPAHVTSKKVDCFNVSDKACMHGRHGGIVLTWPRSTSGAVHSGVPAWLLADIHVLLRTRDSPKSHTCPKALTCQWTTRGHSSAYTQPVNSRFTS